MAKDIIVQTGKPVGYQQLSVTNTAVALTIPLNANRALIVVEDAAVRWRDDGTDPTATVGVQLFQNQSFEITHPDSLSAIKFIRVTNTNAELNISYYQRD